MDRNFFINLGKSGYAFPIGTDLIVHEATNPLELVNNGELLGKAVANAASIYQTPLAFPLMDLKIEKALILEILGIHPEQMDTYHFDSTPSNETIHKIEDNLEKHWTHRMKATCGALEYITEKTNLIPVGMCIGPFSLMTKLVSDPITPVYLLGMGTNPEEDDSVSLVNRCLQLSTIVIKSYIQKQINSGAKAVIMCEPAANKIYISPTQIEEGSDVFKTCVLEPGLEIKETLNKNHSDLILHDCGELTDYMIKEMIKMDPVILSLGSSRKLWEDAKIVPKNIVLYGNLPSKHFYSDEKVTEKMVAELSQELINKMKNLGHPFILGTECDVLSVPEANDKIKSKVKILTSFSACHN